MPELARSVGEALERLVDALPDGTAKLADAPAALGERTSSFTVTRTRGSAARIHVDVVPPNIYPSLGRGAVYELGPQGRDSTDLTQLDELRALCLAAIRGDFTETVWMKGDDAVGGRGRARVGSGEVGHFWRQAFTNPFRRTTKHMYPYDPYDSSHANPTGRPLP
jgi:hypothetical protein